MIRAIVFDCFGVLTTESWQLFKSTLPQDQIEPARSLMHQSTYGYISYEVFIAELAKLTSRSEAEISSALRHELAKNEPLFDYVRFLKDKGYKIGLLSNIANNWITDTFLTPKEQKLFDAMVLSFEVGMVKPDPRIFHLMCEKLDVETSEAIMVDDIDRYCYAAEAEGMKSVVYTDFQQTRREIEEHISN